MQSWRVRPDHRAAVSAGCLCILLAAALAGPAHARVALSAPEPQPTSGVFVSPAGSDATGSGTLERPYRTLGRAAAVVRAGETVYVRGGVYGGRTKITRSGSATAPIRFKPYPGESVTLDGSGVPMAYHQSLVTIWRSSHVIFEGFEIRDTAGRGLSVIDGDHVVLRDNAVHDTFSHPMMASGDHITFAANDVYRGALVNRDGAASGWPGGLSSWSKSDGTRSTDVTFRANRVHDTWGEGIIALHVDGAAVTGNTVHDVWSVGIYVDNASDVDVERNFVYRTSRAYDRGGRPAQGIMLANEHYAGTPARPVEDVLIANNVVVGAEHAVAYWSDSRRPTGNTYRDVRIYHNVFTGTRGSTLWLQDVPDGQTQPRGNVARNNIVLRGADGATLDIGDPGGWSFSHNAFPGGIPGGSHPSSLGRDVMLVDPVASAGLDGFKLRAGSPAVAAGKRVPEAGSDLWNTPRRARPSIGVHER